MIKALIAWKTHVSAVDVPSGFDGTTGMVRELLLMRLGLGLIAENFPAMLPGVLQQINNQIGHYS